MPAYQNLKQNPDWFGGILNGGFVFVEADKKG
jgi:hypothetical protein